MKVELLSCTPDALTLLLRTKATRLRHMSDPATWSDAQRAEHLSYMRDTIKSSWEFVDYVFEISGVSRAFTHQLVRTRTGSYAQESQRTVDVSDHSVLEPASIANSMKRHGLWTRAKDVMMAIYADLLNDKTPVQDARGILPTNITTSIVAKFSLRTLHEMAKVRLCTRTQGEYQNVFREMRRLVIETHPWVGEFMFLEVACVGDGRCAFPRYGQKECRFYRPWMDTEAQQLALRLAYWDSEQQVANPVAKDGRTM